APAPPSNAEQDLVMKATLEHLLKQLRDRSVAGNELLRTLARVRELVERDERVPDELRPVLFTDPADAESDAAGLLVVLGRDDLGEVLALALEIEAGPGVVDPAAEEAAWAPVGAALRESIARAAGRIEVASDVAVMAGLPALPPLAQALAWAAGPI